MHGRLSVASTMAIAQGAIFKDAPKFWGMMRLDQLKPVRHGIASSREQGYYGPRSIPSQWTLADVCRPDYSCTPDPIPRLEHLLLRRLVYKNKKYRIKGAVAPLAVTPVDSTSRIAESSGTTETSNQWSENRPDPWENPGQEPNAHR